MCFPIFFVTGSERCDQHIRLLSDVVHSHHTRSRASCEASPEGNGQGVLSLNSIPRADAPQSRSLYIPHFHSLAGSGACEGVSIRVAQADAACYALHRSTHCRIGSTSDFGTDGVAGALRVVLRVPCAEPSRRILSRMARSRSALGKH